MKIETANDKNIINDGFGRLCGIALGNLYTNIALRVR